MKLDFSKPFLKQARRLQKPIREALNRIIENLEQIHNLSQVHNLKQLKSSSQDHKKFYRIRLGDFRLGLYTDEENTVYLRVIAHRREFYQEFP